MKVEFDGDLDLIVVGGVKISLQLLYLIANPDSNKYYQLVRDGEIVTVKEFVLTNG